MKWNILFISIVVAAVCLVLFVESKDVKYNNSSAKDTLITTDYSSSEIEKIQYCINYGGMNFEEFKKEFRIECLRKTHQGYYVILRQDNQKNAFVFINDDLELVRVMNVNEFKSKEEFETNVKEGMTLDEILFLGFDAVSLPISSVSTYAYIVKEGVFIVTYLRNDNGNILDEPIVDNIYFYSDEDIMSTENEFISLVVPYILEIDKVSQ